MTEDRFYSLGKHLKKIFDERVHKISVQVPTVGTAVEGGYSLCAGGTIAAPPDEMISTSVGAQLAAAKDRVRQRFKFGKFIAHIHAAPGVLTSMASIQAAVDEIAVDNEVIGLNITTRPYCLTPEMTRFLRNVSKQMFTWLELGLHSTHDETLQKIGMRLRWSEVRDNVMALMGTKMHIAPHVVFGLPGETPAMMRETMRVISRMGFEGMNIHHFYVLRGCRFEQAFNEGKLSMISREEYVNLTCDFIEMLQPETVLHRIVGEVPDDRLLGPDWTLAKKENVDIIVAELARRGSVQGRYWDVVEMTPVFTHPRAAAAVDPNAETLPISSADAAIAELDADTDAAPSVENAKIETAPSPDAAPNGPAANG